MNINNPGHYVHAGGGVPKQLGRKIVIVAIAATAFLALLGGVANADDGCEETFKKVYDAVPREGVLEVYHERDFAGWQAELDADQLVKVYEREEILPADGGLSCQGERYTMA